MLLFMSTYKLINLTKIVEKLHFQQNAPYNLISMHLPYFPLMLLSQVPKYDLKTIAPLVNQIFQ